MPTSVIRFAVGALFVVLMGGSTIYALVKPTSGQTATPNTARSINGISCDPAGPVAVHYHVHLDMFVAGHQVTLPGGIGIPSGGLCVYWLHTHDSSGVIHVEAPAAQTTRTFTLGDFFAIWGKAPTTTSLAIVDGRRYTGAADGIVLKAHELITLEMSSPEVPQPDFHFGQGL